MPGNDEFSNIGVALRTYLRESTVLISSDYLGSSQNILLGFPRNADGSSRLSVPPFLNRLIIQVARGGPGDLGLGRMGERIEFWCYGVNEVQCKKIARGLMQYMIPTDVRRKTSFTRDGCQINSMTLEGGPLSITDPDAADWPYTLVTYIFDYNTVIRT